MRKFAVVLAIVAVMAGPAFAGGGGSKATSTIKVTNNGTPANGAVAAAVVVDPPGGDVAFWNAVLAAPDPLAFLKSKGGQVIDFGANKLFKVKAGAHSVSAVLYGLAPGVVPVGAVATKNYTIGIGVTSLTITNGATLTP